MKVTIVLDVTTIECEGRFYKHDVVNILREALSEYTAARNHPQLGGGRVEKYLEVRYPDYDPKFLEIKRESVMQRCKLAAKLKEQI